MDGDELVPSSLGYGRGGGGGSDRLLIISGRVSVLVPLMFSPLYFLAFVRFLVCRFFTFFPSCLHSIGPSWN